MGKYVGEPIKRVEDPRLIRGEAKYIDDIRLPGMLYAAVWSIRLLTTLGARRPCYMYT